MDGCIEWTKSRKKNGYGLIFIGGKKKFAHRHYYELKHGPIPPGMFVCHKCDNPACYNVDHLFLGTPQDNMDDMKKKGRAAWGERIARSTLKKSQVLEIRALHETGTISNRALASRYGVHPSNISFIVNRKRWTRI